MITRRALETLDHFPSIAQIEELVNELGVKMKPATNVVRLHCPNCKGSGYFLMFTKDRMHSAVAACPSCATGRDLRQRERHPLPSEDQVMTRGYTQREEMVLSEDNSDPKVKARERARLDAERRSPWPLGMEALMLKIESGDNRAMDKALQFNRLSESEAWFLWDCFKEARFDDATALELIVRTRDQSIGSGIARMLAPKREGT